MVSFLPLKISLFGFINVHWSGLFLLISLLIGGVLVAWIGIRQKQGLKPSMVADFMIYLGVGILVGARLGYVLFDDPQILFLFKSDWPFWGPLAFGEGGLSDLGAVVGGAVGCWLYSLRSGLSRRYLFDLGALLGVFVFSFVRLGTFLQGQGWGRPLGEGESWGFVFPTEIIWWPTQSPAQLLSLTPVIERMDGSLLPEWLKITVSREAVVANMDSLQRVLSSVLTSWDHRPEIQAGLESLLALRHPLSLYESVLQGFFVFFVLFMFWRKPRRSGVVAAMMICLTMVAHLGLEFFFSPQLSGSVFYVSSMVSIFLFIVGIGLLIFWGRASAMQTPGWGRARQIKIHRR